MAYKDRNGAPPPFRQILTGKAQFALVVNDRLSGHPQLSQTADCRLWLELEYYPKLFAFILESGKIKHYWIDSRIGFRSCRRFYGMADTAAFQQNHYYDIG